MGAKQPRYRCTGKVSINGQSVTGLLFVLKAENTFSGKKKAKGVPKRDLTHVTMAFDNPKEAKTLGLDLAYVWPKTSIEKFFVREP